MVAGCSLGEAQPLDPAISRRIGDLKARLMEHPGDPNLLSDLGAAYADGGRLFEAADAYQEAIDHGANTPKTHAGLAETYLRVGYVSRSVDELRSCMTLDRSSPDCLFALAHLFEAEGSPQGLKEARTSLQQFLTLAPQHPRRAEAEKALERVEARIGQANADEGKADPSIPAHAQIGQEEGGEAEGLDQGSELPPGHPSTGAQLPAGHPSTGGAEAPPQPGSADMIPGHENRAGDGSEVGALNPFGAALAKAYAAVRANDPATAEKSFREALALKANDPTALSGLAQTLLVEGKKDDAAKAAEDAVSIDPGDPQTRFTYGYVMFKLQRNMKRALETWEGLERDEPEYAKKSGVTDMLAKLKAGAAGAKPSTP
jgi:cytochrome c-type biogenesis protein CcmH/NrfG